MKKIFLKLILLPVFLFCVSNNVFAYTITKFAAQSLCASSFPTAWVSGSFSIAESTKREFTKNKSNNTIVFVLPAGWEYSTTVSVTGLSTNDITAISIARTSATQLTVTLTTANTALDLNTITVSCQIRATSATAALFIKRDGGTFDIAKSDAKPTTVESLGDLSAEATMAYTSSNVTQASTANVSQGTLDNHILRVEVLITGPCSAFNLTELNFNTTGSTSAADITTARVYYTGLSSTFATTGLFGSSSSPSGTFSITGSRALTAGTNYFWLVYDVPGTATVSNVLDATCTSITVNGIARTPSPDTNPSGNRTIISATQFYSIATGDWSDNTKWSSTDGGSSCACLPTSSGSVFINTNHTITLNATNTVNFLTIRDGAVLQDNGSNTLTVSTDFNTLLSGRFAATSDWTVSGNLILSGTGASTTTKDITVTGSSTIRSGTSLTENGAGGNDIILKGNLTLNGTLSSGTAGGTIIMDGSSTQTISSSTGTVSGTGALTLSGSGNKTIAELTTLTISPTVAILGAITVTNNGTVTLSGNLTGESGSTWTNAANSTLNTAGTVLATGTLTATASPNTVNYNKATAQTVKTTTYNKLTISNAGTKTFQSAGTISVANLVTIQDAAIFDVGTNTLSGAGGLTMTGTSELKIAKTHASTMFPELTGAYNLTGGTVTLNQGGSATQKANDGPKYYNLKLDGGASSVYSFNALITVVGNFTHSTSGTTTLGAVDEDMIVTGSSTFSNGTFDAGGSDLKTSSVTLTSGTLTGGTGTIEITGAGGWTKNGGTYTNTSNTVLFSGTAEQTIAGTDATTFNSLTLNNSSGLSLSADATVSGGTLTLTSGIIKTNANRVIVGSAGSAGTVTITSGHVNGNLRRFVPNALAPTVAYAIGDATNYTPASITFAGTTSGSGYLDASTSAIDPTFGALSGGSDLSNEKYIKRRWVVTKSSGLAGFTSYSPTFTFVSGDIKGSAATGSLVIRKLDGSTWASTTVGTRTSTSTQSTGLSTFSEFAVGETAESCQPTVSAAGADQSIYTTTATLAGNTPSVGTGAWTLISGTGTITTTGSATSGLTALGVGANTFRWTISNSPCAASTDDVIITRAVQRGMPLDLLIGY